MQITYDLYKPYVDKNASGERLLLVSRLAIAFFGLIMAVVSVAFYKVGSLWAELTSCLTERTRACVAIHSL